MRGYLKTYLRALDDLGVEIVGTEVTGSNHYKITVTADGNQQFFIAGFSSSDHRALMNFRAMVKRWRRSIPQRERA